jgi:peptide/nickel transport system permease protein
MVLVALSSVVVFALVAAAGDPTASLRLDPDISTAQLASRRHELHLDEPVAARYIRWVAGVGRGDLGRSLDGRPVRALLWARLQVTLRMVVAGSLLGLAGAVLLGAWSAHRPYSWTDHGIAVMALIVLSVPVFWLGAMLKWYVAFGVNRVAGHRILATLGEADPNLAGGLLTRLGNYASHLALPTFALAAVLAGAWSRYLRASMLEVLGHDHIRAARARGVPEWRLTLGHALGNAVGPFATLVAVDFAQVLGGVVVLERVFGWHGMGELLIDGVLASDVNVVLAWLLVTASLVVMANLLADVLLARLDPRVRLGRAV